MELFGKYLSSPSFLLENGIDYTLLTEKLLEKLIKLGLRKINFSLASSSENILQKENRILNLSRFESLVSMAYEYKIPVTTYFICGFKNETAETVAENLAYLFNIRTELGISMFYAVPGLSGFEDRTVFRHPALSAGSSAYPWNRSLTTETLITAFRISRFINCCRNNLVKNS